MNEQRLLETFLELVSIDSPSRSEAGVALYCQGVLEELGFSVRFDQAFESTGSNTGNLIAVLEGSTSARIALSAHMDCVDPCEGIEPYIEEGIIRSRGETILSADDKAGIAGIFEALRSVLEEGVSRPTITVILTTCEELSLIGAAALQEDVFFEGEFCFVFDADGAPGTVITDSPFHYTFDALFTGRAAHAGVAPETGNSAAQMAAFAISRMELGRIDECTTANVGLIEGGREVNIVPDSCRVLGECRSLSLDRVEACKENIGKALDAGAEKFGGGVDVIWRLDYEGIHYEQDDPLISILAQAAKEAGIALCFATTGGGADSNIFQMKGARAVTLGIGMTDFHSPDEFITVEDLNATARFAESIIHVTG